MMTLMLGSNKHPIWQLIFDFHGCFIHVFHPLLLSKAENTLHDCHADYEWNLLLTTDRAQSDHVCSSWAQSLFAVDRKSCIVCGV